MSHYKERVEKDCLNCGTQVEGRFCQQCGQENIIARESFWSLLTHFVYDITHFDSKFFGTMKVLLTKPGQLSLEYIRGKRVSQLHPIRMYVFTSAFFFIIFFSLYKADRIGESDFDRRKAKLEKLELAKTVVTEKPLLSADSTERKTARSVLADLEKEIAGIKLEIREEEREDSLDQLEKVNISDTLKKAGINVPGNITVQGKESEFFTLDTGSDSSNDAFSSVNYESLEAYRRMQAALPADKKDSWVKKAFVTKIIAAVETGKIQGERAYLKNFLYNLFHSMPKMLFVSLPIFALFLGWLYGRRKELTYSDHAIFTIHTYCATFIFLLGTFALSSLQETTGWGIINLLQVIITIAVYLYLYKGMRRFYGDSRRKTIIKFILLNILSFFMMSLLLVIFTAISAAQVGNSAH
ncbi:DUF3667 domain-containing protein [Flavihumibacter sp. CACIAM 22H1]|uniref:DUF3667 domain-containing protein n=1 Tax=Flavihumibacter sp. CACIAM 22H1 TaxID=1812911 RepID=UPI0007A83883|nr:DUF3667 domain-containing protein [Flavihumibacter sp. CACIAM 22H1]KYP15160.1 MAG: hypothetical protein A1D16_00355 [Flavihumibacter sp. CACIAM 22H1]